MTTRKADAADDRREDDVDARIEALKRKAAALNDGQMRTHVSPDCPRGIEEQFWKQIVAFHAAVEEAPFDVLVRSGLTLPPPEELDEAQIAAKLWEMIHGLALLGVYLLFTDHLSDRDLYGELWRDMLREPMALQADDPDMSWHVDLTGRGGEGEIVAYLKYYADDDDRHCFAREWPDVPMPERAQRPFDRDRHLPQPPYARRLSPGG